MGEVDCDSKSSDSRREAHVITRLLRSFATRKLDILDARCEFMNRSELPLIVDDGANRLAFVHEIESAIDFFQWHGVGNHFVNLDLTGKILIYIAG